MTQTLLDATAAVLAEPGGSEALEGKFDFDWPELKVKRIR